MASDRKVISVPKTPKESFNPDRPASDLLRSQALHLHEALARHVGEIASVLAINPRQLQTEREASDYIQKVTAILHPHAAEGPGR
jgi:hypothetical protein